MLCSVGGPEGKPLLLYHFLLFPLGLTIIGILDSCWQWVMGCPWPEQVSKLSHKPRAMGEMVEFGVEEYRTQVLLCCVLCVIFELLLTGTAILQWEWGREMDQGYFQWRTWYVSPWMLFPLNLCLGLYRSEGECSLMYTLAGGNADSMVLSCVCM